MGVPLLEGAGDVYAFDLPSGGMQVALGVQLVGDQMAETRCRLCESEHHDGETGRPDRTRSRSRSNGKRVRSRTAVMGIRCPIQWAVGIRHLEHVGDQLTQQPTCCDDQFRVDRKVFAEHGRHQEVGPTRIAAKGQPHKILDLESDGRGDGMQPRRRTDQ